MKGQIALFFLMISTWGYAQESSSGAGFSLDDCIEYALAHSIDIKNARLDEEIAKARVKETIGIGLPQVSGSVNVQHSPTQPRFFSQYIESENGQDAFSFITPDQAQSLGMESGDVFAAENFFQLKSNGDASLNVDQMIFNGSYIVGLQASNAYKELSIREARRTRETVVLDVSKAYYNLLISRERLVQLESNMARIDTLHRNTAAMYESGFAEKIDVDRIKVNLNNLRVELQNLRNMTDLALKMLKFQMNYPFDQELIIAGDLTYELVRDVVVQQTDDWQPSERPDYQVLEANYKLQQLNIKNKYAEAIPTISGFVNLGYSTQSPGFGGLFQTNSGFNENEQFGIGPDKWYSYSTLGIRMSWNVFTGLQRTFQIQQEKLELQKIENNFKSLERSIELDISQSRDNLQTALERLEVQRENMNLAREVYDVSQIKYEQGVGSNLEVIEADDSLKEAQTNYYSALYDAIIAQLDLKKALGILHN